MAWKEPKDKYSNAWSRWLDHVRGVERKERDGSSQINASWSTTGRVLIAEILAEDIHRNVFSSQPGKEELSRHIANRVAKFVDLYAESQFWTRFDFRSKYPQALLEGEHARQGAEHFKQKYGKAYQEAQAAVKARHQATLDRWTAERKEREAKAAEVARAKPRRHARVRSVPSVPTPDTPREDGGGS